jgi:hypothetical protein
MIERHFLQHKTIFLLLTQVFELKTSLDALTTVCILSTGSLHLVATNCNCVSSLI